MQIKPSQGPGNPAQETTPPQWPQGQPGTSYTPSPPLPPAAPVPFSTNAPGGGQSGSLPGGQYPETRVTPTPPQRRPNTETLLNNDGMRGFFPGHNTPPQPGPNSAISPSPIYPGNMPGPAPQQAGYAQPPASFAPPAAPPMRRPGPQPGYPMPQQGPQSRPPMVLPAPPGQVPGGFQNGTYYASTPEAPARPQGPAYPGTRGGPNSPQQWEYARESFQQRGPAPQVMPPRWIPPSSPPTRKRRKAGRILLRVALALLVFLLLAGGAGYWYYQQNFAQSINTITGKAAIHSQNSKLGTTPTVQTNPNQNAMLTGGRVNIVLLGSDTDGKGNDVQNGTPLAQTVIIVTIDPQTKYVGMLSIPRDMQVTDPVSGGHPKLDEVFSYGYRGNTVSDRVASAAGRIMDTIEYNFGIHVDHYAWVGLTGFVKVIDTAGGVDVDATHPMVDDVYPDDTNNPNGSIYDFKRLYIAPGPQHMNGLQALEYVRTRHSDLVGDFGRSQRQQQILTQLKMKLATPDIIPKAPELLNDLQGALQTDLTLDQMYPLANFARTIDTNKIDRLTLSPPYASPSGVNTNYFPVCNQIVPKISTMFGLGDNAKCIPQTANASNNTAVASTQPTPSTASMPTAATMGTMTTDNAWQLLGAFSQAASAGLSQGSQGLVGINGIHDLLDLMFCVVFESFDAMKV